LLEILDFQPSPDATPSYSRLVIGGFANAGISADYVALNISKISLTDELFPAKLGSGHFSGHSAGVF